MTNGIGPERQRSLLPTHAAGVLGADRPRDQEVDDRLALFLGHALEAVQHAADEHVAPAGDRMDADDGVLGFDIIHARGVLANAQVLVYGVYRDHAFAA